MLLRKTYRFSFSAVSTQAAHTSIHNLKDTEYHLDQRQTQKYGEQHDVPENHILGKDTLGPYSLIR